MARSHWLKRKAALLRDSSSNRRIRELLHLRDRQSVFSNCSEGCARGRQERSLSSAEGPPTLKSGLISCCGAAAGWCGVLPSERRKKRNSRLKIGGATRSCNGAVRRALGP